MYLAEEQKADSNFGDLSLNVMKVIKSSVILTCKQLAVSIWIVSTGVLLESQLGEALRCLLKFPICQEFP